MIRTDSSAGALPRLALLTALAFVFAAPLGAQERRDRDRDTKSNAVSEEESRAKQSRSGAGLRVSRWDVRGYQAPANGKVDESPLFEGYFQKGLDLHLALENTASVWRRKQTRTTTTGGLFPGSSTTEVTSYVIPLFTSLKVLPFTRPGQPVEPFFLGGLGFVFGVDDTESSTGGGGINVGQGFGIKGGAGVELRLNNTFGVTAGGRYQWIRFFTGEIGGAEKFQGFGADLGLTYRFQFR